MLKSLPAFFIPLFLFILLDGCTAQHIQTTAPSPETKQILQQYSALPLRFEQNKGQLPKAIRYMARGPGYKVLFKPDLTQITLVDSLQN